MYLHLKLEISQDYRQHSSNNVPKSYPKLVSRPVTLSELRFVLLLQSVHENIRIIPNVFCFFYGPKNWSDLLEKLSKILKCIFYVWPNQRIFVDLWTLIDFNLAGPAKKTKKNLYSYV